MSGVGVERLFGWGRVVWVEGVWLGRKVGWVEEVGLMVGVSWSWLDGGWLFGWGGLVGWGEGLVGWWGLVGLEGLVGWGREKKLVEKIGWAGLIFFEPGLKVGSLGYGEVGCSWESSWVDWMSG